MEVIGLYRRMLETWSQSAKKYELTGADMKRIIAAPMHPDHR
jgi:uncharacterized protein YfbU (UPF0304 family)